MKAKALALSADRDDAPDADLCAEEKTLWLARKGRWHEAHDLCQDLPNPAGAWIHAWLHRQEGDYGNACYWYRQAGKAAVAEGASLEDEWMEIAEGLCR